MQKDIIKNAIKCTQMTKKAQQAHHGTAVTTPPSLCHSVPSMPTTAEIYPDSAPHSGQNSAESTPLSQPYDFPHFAPDGLFQMPLPMQQHVQYPNFSPYEIDIKTERSIFVNDVPMRKDSTISTFSTYQPPSIQSDGISTFPADGWVQHEHHESLNETFLEEPLDFNFFDFQHGQMSPNHEAVLEVDDGDKYLLNHFLDKVIKLIFPVLDANQHGSVRTDVIVPALESNKAYLHCCLSIAGVHMKATQGLSGEQIDNDILRNRYAAITDLCEALGNENSDHAKILEATLGMIFFQCSVGRSKDALADIPWHQHFQAASELVNTLMLPNLVVAPIKENSEPARPPFNMTLTSWIDILGATMAGRAPTYADTYRELNVQCRSAGLAELMGCDDRIMFLVSEIACLDSQKNDITELALCNYVNTLANEILRMEPQEGAVQNCFSATGAIRPKQLRTNLTAVFAFAARIYLCTLVPGNDLRAASMRHVVNRFTAAMGFIPEGPDGFDRCLAWPLLMAGANAAPETEFRSMFAARCAKLGDAAEFGSLGRVRELLHDVWTINDANAAAGDLRGVHWRDVMQSKDWDFLLI